MTVCVAAIAEGGEKIILATDNMITVAIGGNIQYQREDASHKKINKLTNGTYALFCGQLSFQESVLRLTLDKISPNASPLEVANFTRVALREFYHQLCQQEILMRFNLNWDIFVNKQQQLNQELVKELVQKINAFTPDIHVIIAGHDDKSGDAFLGLAGGIGYLFERTLEGFLTSGSGGELAKFSLILHDYSPSLGAEKAEGLVRQAIIDAKKSPGVGDLGDLVIISRPAKQSNPQYPKRDL